MKFSKLLFIALITTQLITVSCSKKMSKAVVGNNTNTTNTGKTEDPIILAEEKASEAGQKVLEIGREMALVKKTIVKGSCWDYINEVYKRAGYGTNKTVVYKKTKSGPYVDISKIQPGDWIYYINYSYNKVEHSGIFVYWKDYKNKIGVTLSYGGERRNEPGRYREYDLKSVYYITRPGGK